MAKSTFLFIPLKFRSPANTAVNWGTALLWCLYVSVWNFSDTDLTVKWNLDCYSKRLELRTDPTLLSHAQEYCSWRHHEDRGTDQQWPSLLTSAWAPFTPPGPQQQECFSPSLITYLSVCSFENAGFVEACAWHGRLADWLNKHWMHWLSFWEMKQSR